MLDLIKPDWQAPTHIKAFTSTRKGGVSMPPYDSLNLGDHVGDQQHLVATNRELLIDFLHQKKLEQGCIRKETEIMQLYWLSQEHSCNILLGSDVDKQRAIGVFDGHYTDQVGVVCTIMTADCMPVFICNQQGTEIALVHAGWRGLADGIVEKTIQLFNSPAEELLIHCGPAISQQFFEIGDDVKHLLGGSENFYQPQLNKKNHFLADLVGLLGERVQTLGVNFTQSKLCTYGDHDKFFSYRRDGVTGRMVSLLWIDKAK